jgi:hypothetical protein
MGKSVPAVFLRFSARLAPNELMPGQRPGVNGERMGGFGASLGRAVFVAPEGNKELWFCRPNRYGRLPGDHRACRYGRVPIHRGGGI